MIAITFDSKDEVFAIHKTSITKNLYVLPFWRPQIALLKLDETSTFIMCKYIHFVDLFLKHLAAKLPKHIGINDYAINIIKR